MHREALGEDTVRVLQAMGVGTLDGKNLRGGSSPERGAVP